MNVNVTIEQTEYNPVIELEENDINVSVNQEQVTYTVNLTIDRTGSAGISAYQVWLNEGNEGTEQDFLYSLVGAQGIQGIQGIQGVAGKTAYESALDGGYPVDKTEEQFNTDLADVSNKESLSNKKTDIETNKDSNTFYATIKSIYDWCIGKFQEKLISGENIKTINSESLLGEGNITITASATTDNTTITGAGTVEDPFKISDEYQRRINAGI